MNVGWCELLTDEGITALAENCPNLTSVDLCGCLEVKICTLEPDFCSSSPVGMAEQQNSFT